MSQALCPKLSCPAHVLCSSLSRHTRPAGTELQKCRQGPTSDEPARRPERSPQHQLPVSLCGAVPDDHLRAQSPVQDWGLQTALLCGRLVCIACMVGASRSTQGRRPAARRAGSLAAQHRGCTSADLTALLPAWVETCSLRCLCQHQTSTTVGPSCRAGRLRIHPDGEAESPQ